jgi:hypothetical protein
MVWHNSQIVDAPPDLAISTTVWSFRNSDFLLAAENSVSSTKASTGTNTHSLGSVGAGACFAETPLAVRALPAVGISFHAASCVSFHMPLGPDTPDSGEYATQPHGTRRAFRRRSVYQTSEVDGRLLQGCSGLGRSTRRSVGLSVRVRPPDQIALDRR